MAKAIVNGVIQFGSVTSMNLADHNTDGGCERKYYYRYVERLPQPPPTPGLIRGNKGHTEVEHYLRTGEDTLGTISRPIKTFLPKPGSDLFVEHSIKNISIGDIPLRGKIDLFQTRGVYIRPDGELHEDSAQGEVNDWKFTGNLDYAKPPTGRQTTVYGVAVCREFDLDKIRLSLVYCQTRAPREARKLTRIAYRDELEESLITSVPVITRMKEIALAKRAQDVDFNHDSCKAYGGCPYLEICPDAKKHETLAESLRKPMSKNLMEKLNLTNPDVDSAAESLLIREALVTIDRFEKGRPDMLGACASAVNKATGDDDSESIAGTGALADIDSLETVQDLYDLAQEIKDRLAITVETATDPPTEEKQESLSETQGGLVSGNKPEKPKVKKKAKAPSKAEVVAENEKLKEQLSAFTRETIKPDSSVTGIVFYRDCFSSTAEDLGPAVSAWADELAFLHNVPDIRVAPKGVHELAFGAWKGALQSHIRKNKPDNGTYFLLSTGSEIRECAAEILEVLAADVVRGVR